MPDFPVNVRKSKKNLQKLSVYSAFYMRYNTWSENKPACSCSDFICAKAHGKFEAVRKPENTQSVFLGFDANIIGSDAYNSYMHIIWID